MNLDDTGTQLLYTTAPIFVERNDGSTVQATGYIANKNSKRGIMPFLVTNKHVVNDARKIVTRVTLMENGSPSRKNKGLNIILNLSELCVDDKFDLCAMPLGHILNDLKKKEISIFYKGVSDEIIPDDEVIKKLSAIEDVIFVGYPSGIYDQENLIPVIRQGITATPAWNDFNRESKFLIDAGVFPGSSGSPVFIYNRGSYLSEGIFTINSRLIFLGILSGTILRKELNKESTYLNLGQVIKSSVITVFLNSLVLKFESQ